MALQEFPAASMTRDPVAIKEAARKGPVAITEHKRPRFVLMSYADYLALTAKTTDPRRSLKTNAIPDDLKALALEALNQPYEP
ncbi:MAG: type II toxin-antitoxin system prevent-host-death family antitoxin [Beijerinckiaceae bacterium]|jgi:prevent-host-death family protein